MAKQDIQEQTQHIQSESKKQQKKQAKQEAKLTLKLKQARKDEQKAEQKLAKAHHSLTISQTATSSLEQRLAQLRAGHKQASQQTAQPDTEHRETEVVDSGDDYDGAEPSEQSLAPLPAEGRDDVLEEQKRLEALGHDVVAVERNQAHAEPGDNSTPTAHDEAAKAHAEEPEEPKSEE
ncbi:MAG TPA: hypothetical protein VHZ51_07720 [Ktedonobacteraceae bacterium]|jgi:hypothetical protein|nr:hypothetical protein [Ktedonobacteraceae bacterium]